MVMSRAGRSVRSFKSVAVELLLGHCEILMLILLCGMGLDTTFRFRFRNLRCWFFQHGRISAEFLLFCYWLQASCTILHLLFMLGSLVVFTI